MFKRFLNRKLAVIAVVFGVFGTIFGGLGVASAATSTSTSTSTTPPPVRISCVVGPNRTSEYNFENIPANFKCPQGFAVSGGAGATGPAGPAGKTGATGPAGANGLAGAYYAEAQYDSGDTNGGAIATVACKSHSDVAISGGVQTLATGENGIKNNVPVSSSFAGRMDWDTNTPIAGDLSGWVVQFGGNSGATSLGDPKTVNIYALCVPSTTIPVVKTFVESAS